MYQRVVVTVKRKDEARVRDLEVPVNLTAERLSEMIARALRWETDMTGQHIHYLIEAHPLGRMLQPDETLASAGVWDGSWLVLHPMHQGSPMPEVVAPTAQEMTPSVPPRQPETSPPPPRPEPEPVAPSAYQAPVTPTHDDEPWDFPPVAAQSTAPEAPVSQPEEAGSSALLEMLLGGAPTTQPAAQPPVVEQQPQPEQQPAAGIDAWAFPVTPEPAPVVQEDNTPDRPMPAVTAPLPTEPTETQGVTWDFAQAQPSPPIQPAPPEKPADDALLGMLLGSTPAQPEEPKPEPQATQAKDDFWTFPVASTAEVQAVQPPPSQEDEEEEETTPAAPSPFDAWAFPVAPEPEPPAGQAQDLPTYTPDQAPAAGGSLLEMLLGDNSAAPQETAAQSQASGRAEPPQATPAPPIYEGQPPVVTPPEPQPDATQAAASTSAQQPATEKPGSKPKAGGFRSLGIDLPPESQPPPDETKPRFVWKKLDD